MVKYQKNNGETHQIKEEYRNISENLKMFPQSDICMVKIIYEAQQGISGTSKINLKRGMIIICNLVRGENLSHFNFFLNKEVLVLLLICGI